VPDLDMLTGRDEFGLVVDGRRTEDRRAILARHVAESDGGRHACGCRAGRPATIAGPSTGVHAGKTRARGSLGSARIR